MNWMARSSWLSWPANRARFCNTPPYNQLSAVKNNRTIALVDGILDLQVPRNIDVIKQLQNRFATK
ncbi:MAG: hypothetical protein J6T88_08820 [Bacteroidales bacterium]|nr:hypothetical protein [Bacteroidales bacterium]